MSISQAIYTHYCPFCQNKCPPICVMFQFVKLYVHQVPYRTNLSRGKAFMVFVVVHSTANVFAVNLLDWQYKYIIMLPFPVNEHFVSVTAEVSPNIYLIRYTRIAYQLEAFQIL